MDPIIVDTPDGGTAEFPAGTPMETMKAALAKRFPKQAVGQGGAPSLPPDPPAERSFLQRGGDFMRDQAGWQATRLLNAGTALVGQNPIVEPIKRMVDVVAPDSGISRMMKYAYPDTQTMRDVAHEVTGTQPVNTPGAAGKILDTGVEMAIGGRAFPGGAIRNTVAGFGAGVGSEGAGQLTKGTKWEPAARLVGGLVGGAATATGTEAVAAAGRGMRNMFGRNNVDQTAGRMIGRAFVDRDKIAPSEIPNRMAALGDDAMVMDAGGPNVRGLLRGATAAPGEARTTVQERFDQRAAGESSRVGASVDRNVSPKGLTQTVDELIKERNTAPKPLYDKALNVDQVWSPRIQQFLDDPLVQPGIKRGLEIQRLEALAKGEPFDPKSYGVTGFNAAGDPIISGTPNMRLLDAAKKGLDAIIDDSRDTTTGRLVMNERTRAIDAVRRAYVAELDNLNPDYAAARRAYAEPSQMKDAAELGKRLFAANIRPDVVKREFARLPDDAKTAFRVGVAEHLREIIGRRDASGIAGRVAGGPDARARLVAVLGEKESAALLRDLATETTFTRNQRDVGQGSRTTPMALEAGDNAAQIGGDVAANLVQGRPGNAILSAIAGMSRRIGQGQNERVNARIAEMLTKSGPEETRALIDALEQSLLDQRISAPRNTFRAGAALPVVNGAPGGVSAVGPSIQPRDDHRERPR